MKTFLLVCDTIIVVAYALLCNLSFPNDMVHIVLVLLFFLSFRALSLAIHDLFSIGNFFLLIFLWQYKPLLLVLPYIFYLVLYFYLYTKEEKLQFITKDNTRLKIETQQSRLYRLLQGKFERQIAINTRLKERQRIAQDIHDLLGHSVTASVLQLEAAKSIMDEEPERAKQMITNATQSLREGIDNIRSVVHQMRAEASDMQAADISAIIDKFMRDTGIIIHYKADGDINAIEPNKWEAIRGNLQEALSNVIKHANASQVWVDLQVMPGMLRLQVRDDGVGAEVYEEGMGISGMRQRIAPFAGSLIIRGIPQKGTTIITLIPRRNKA
ncbi:MAG: sensor histidine kinase [Christensenellaceae bacterium]|nr:sensor histidine kinase [Christensenellaceae bacterium]